MLHMPPHANFIAFVLTTVVAAALLAPHVSATHCVMIGFDLGAAQFLAMTFARLLPASTHDLRHAAARNDAGRVLTLLVAAILIGVLMVMLTIELRRAQFGTALDLALVVLTLALAWLFVNIVYAIHYLHLFYDKDDKGMDRGGLGFPGTERPDFADFCYFALVLGMTFQVSDVRVTDGRLRRVATWHGLVAFLLNIGAIAITVNVIASGGK